MVKKSTQVLNQSIDVDAYKKSKVIIFILSLAYFLKSISQNYRFPIRCGLSLNLVNFNPKSINIFDCESSLELYPIMTLTDA